MHQPGQADVDDKEMGECPCKFTSQKEERQDDMRQENVLRRNKYGRQPATVQNVVGMVRERVRESESQNNDVLSMAETMSMVAT